MPQRDSKLLQDLIDKYAKTFAKLAYKYGVPASYAEDIAFDAIWTYFNSDRYADKDETEGKKIMAAIVRNKSYDYLRKELRNDVVEVDIDDEEVNIQLVGSDHYEPERAVIANEGYQRIIRTIENLRPVWRDVVKMYFVEEYSYTEISEALGITEDVCRSRISRARKYLEEELKDMLE